MFTPAIARRAFVAIPSAEKVEFTRKNGWTFPDRTVIVKSFAVEQDAGRKWVETRFFTKQAGE